MKFVHIADLHLDAPFTSLSGRDNLQEKRKLEQRKIFLKIINYIKENNIDYFFIAGDLYEHEYIKKTSIDFLNNCFKEIPNTKVFISPGNHDPYIVNSFYDTYNFAENVFIFRGGIEKVEEYDVNIYGMAFNSFYMDNNEINEFELLKSIKPNIFLAHIDLNGSKNENGFSYNPVSISKLKSLKFDYIAMGHIHTTNYIEGKENSILYSGSPMAMGFDETGKHGMIVGEINANKISTEFVKLDDREFIQEEIDVQSFYTREDLIMYLSNLNLYNDYFYEIVLVGNRNFEIDEKEILSLVEKENILKVKDYTKANYDLEQIARERSLRGYFVREALNYLDSEIYTREEIEKAIEIGLESMKQ